MVVVHVVRDVRLRATFRRRRPGADETMPAPGGLQQRRRAARTVQPLSRPPQGVRRLLFHPWGAIHVRHTGDAGMYPFTNTVNLFRSPTPRAVLRTPSIVDYSWNVYKPCTRLHSQFRKTAIRPLCLFQNESPWCIMPGTDAGPSECQVTPSLESRRKKFQ